MSNEIRKGKVVAIDNSDLGRVMVYGLMENNDQFGLTTLVPNCALKQGDSVNVIVDTEDTIPLPDGTNLGDLPSAIWGNACNACKHNPYVPKDPKQCAAAKHL